MRGLVLGGGGFTGIAWELGLVAGLAELGVDLTTADVAVGTSAGSVVGAQVLGGTPIEELYADQLADAGGVTGSQLGLWAMTRFVIASAWPGDPRRSRARLARASMRASTVPEPEFRGVFESMLNGLDWPERDLRIAAVDAESGEARVFERDSGAELLDAVLASCAWPLVYPPMTVDGRRYIDGGVRSSANADLATGCDRVVVVAPVAFAVKRSQRIDHQLSLLGGDVRTAVVTADAAARKAFGRNPLDPARRAASARAGREQAARVVDGVRAAWLS